MIWFSKYYKGIKKKHLIYNLFKPNFYIETFYTNIYTTK